MKKNSWKKLVSLIFAFMFSIAFVFGADDVHASILKPGQVTGVSLTRTSGTAVKLSWDEVSESQGYAVYMKTNKGGYQLIKTTKATSLNKSGLAIGNSYCFKVRAYKKVRSKKIYGQSSDVVKKKMANYEYLPDVMEWYSKEGDIMKYKDTDSISLYDNDYYHSIVSKVWNSSYNLSGTGSIYYNLKGKYSRIEFSYCSFWEDEEGKAMFFADEELKETLTTSPNILPKKVSIDVEDTYVFKIYLEHCALLNVKLYY